ncbi:glyoxalase [uncultured Polaribacter sp.]|uniref:glyoxalase n=1 Tax=uncultured Polaribacter sp. TaxID=174711 RepID=UPI00261AF81B|nr:glyoxalase [uncultured Polaribacter sp.]
MTKERPVLEDLIKENMSEFELFQNKTLRPIIKMQHALLIASFKNYLQKRKIDFNSLSEQKKRGRISSIYKTDNNYKNMTVGFIAGHFTEDEFDFYNTCASEVNRRILQITTQRIQDSIADLK